MRRLVESGGQCRLGAYAERCKSFDSHLQGIFPELKIKGHRTHNKQNNESK